MDRVVLAIAATAIHQVGHIEQPLHTLVRPTDRVVFAIVATAKYQVDHI